MVLGRWVRFSDEVHRELRTSDARLRPGPHTNADRHGERQRRDDHAPQRDGLCARVAVLRRLRRTGRAAKFGEARRPCAVLGDPRSRGTKREEREDRTGVNDHLVATWLWPRCYRLIQLLGVFVG